MFFTLVEYYTGAENEKSVKFPTAIIFLDDKPVDGGANTWYLSSGSFGHSFIYSNRDPTMSNRDFTIRQAPYYTFGFKEE